MKKISLVKSIFVTITVSVLMLGVGYFLLVDGEVNFISGSLVDASDNAQESKIESSLSYSVDVEKVLASGVTIENDGNFGQNGDNPDQQEDKTLSETASEATSDSEAKQQEASGSGQVQEPLTAANQSSASAPVDQKKSDDVAQASKIQSQPSEQQTKSSSADKKQGETESASDAGPVETKSSSTETKQEEPVVASNSELVETQSEQPASVPEPVVQQTIATMVDEPTVPSNPPVTYSWGSSRNYTFRTEVKVINNDSATSHNVEVAVPLLESSSPYQSISLKSVNYSVISNSGRVSTFNLGDLAPGETKTIVVDMNVTVKTVSINSNNGTVDKARKAYEQYSGSGNCRTLAQGFISKCREMGITAREVVGYARPQRGAMTSGSLQGCRHSWAEFYVDGLGWVPVDLTFQYFGEFPHTSHIVEGYGDQSISINYSGGSLGASWSNLIL